MKALLEHRTYRDNFAAWHGILTNVSSSAHWHREIELVRVRQGLVSWKIFGQKMQAGEGDLILLESGDIHQYESDTPDTILDCVMFDPILISKYRYVGVGCHLLSEAQLKEAGLAARWEEIGRDLDIGKAYYGDYWKEIAIADIQAFWIRCLLLCMKNGKQNQAVQDEAQRRELHRALDYIEEHYDEDLSLTEVAKKMGFSSSYFSRTFKEMTGINFKEWLNKVRISYAQELLLKSEQSIADIALSCGYGNLRNFYRVFTKLTGCSPSEYSKQAASYEPITQYFRSTSLLRKMSGPQIDNPLEGISS